MPQRRLMILTPGPTRTEGTALTIADALAARGHSVTIEARTVKDLGDALARSAAQVAIAFGAAACARIFAAHGGRPPMPVVLRLSAEDGTARPGALVAAATPILTRAAARTLVATDAERRALVRRAFVPSRRVIVVPDPAPSPPGDVPTAEAIAARDPFVALADGGEADTLCRALALMRTRAQLVATAPCETLIRAARHHGMAGRIATAEGLGAVLSGAKVFVHAAAGPRPLAPLLAALGHGLAAVATRSGGPEEVLAEGRFGRIVPQRDPQALALALDAALADPGDPAPRHARALEYTPDRIAARFEATVEAVLTHRSP